MRDKAARHEPEMTAPLAEAYTTAGNETPRQ
jgi:hypothetical protein